MDAQSASCLNARLTLFPALVVIFLGGLCTSALANTGCRQEGELTSGQLGARLDEFLTQATKDGFSGAVLVAKDGDIILRKGYGLADRAQDIPNTADTVFNICSVSKIFTAAAILKLEMQGKLRVGDPINKYLGDFPGEKSGATIHHLLTHTAGLVVRGAPLDGSSREAFIQTMKDAPIESAPGEEYRYTNAGYSLLAAIVEKVSGQSFQSYLKETLFKPARMMCTDFAGELSDGNSRIARGYPKDPVGPYEWGDLGAGGIMTIVSDLHKWEQALQGSSILSPAAKKKAFTPYVRDEGYGWHVTQTNRGTTLHRRGCGNPGFEGEFQRYIDDKLVVIFTINNRERWRVPIGRGIENIVFEQESRDHGVD